MHTQHMPHIIIVNRLEANKERFRPEGFNHIRPHSIRSLQFDQKVRPLSFRSEKFDLFTDLQLRCYAEKPTPFWFSSLDQMSHFGTKKLCRTFENSFG